MRSRINKVRLRQISNIWNPGSARASRLAKWLRQPRCARSLPRLLRLVARSERKASGRVGAPTAELWGVLDRRFEQREGSGHRRAGISCRREHLCDHEESDGDDGKEIDDRFRNRTQWGPP